MHILVGLLQGIETSMQSFFFFSHRCCTSKKVPAEMDYSIKKSYIPMEGNTWCPGWGVGNTTLSRELSCRRCLACPRAGVEGGVGGGGGKGWLAGIT